jgi:Mor family transcriptional regulator
MSNCDLHDLKTGPSLLLEIFEILKIEAERHGLKESLAIRLSMSMTKRLAVNFGGKTLYIPSLQKVEKAIRNRDIYKDFDGKNIFYLSKKYKLSDRKIRQVIAEQRLLMRTTSIVQDRGERLNE